MLIASDIAKRHTANPPSRHALEVERSAATAEDFDMIATGADQQDGAIGHEDFIFIAARPYKHLILRPGILKRGAGPWVSREVGRIDDQCFSTRGIRRRIGYDMSGRSRSGMWTFAVWRLGCAHEASSLLAR